MFHNSKQWPTVWMLWLMLLLYLCMMLLNGSKHLVFTGCVFSFNILTKCHQEHSSTIVIHTKPRRNVWHKWLAFLPVKLTWLNLVNQIQHLIGQLYELFFWISQVCLRPLNIQWRNAFLEFTYYLAEWVAGAAS